MPIKPETIFTSRSPSTREYWEDYELHPFSQKYLFQDDQQQVLRVATNITDGYVFIDAGLNTSKSDHDYGGEIFRKPKDHIRLTEPPAIFHSGAGGGTPALFYR